MSLFLTFIPTNIKGDEKRLRKIERFALILGVIGWAISMLLLLNELI